MKLHKSLLFLAILGISGCSVLPHPTPLSAKEVSEINNSIVDGKTTISEIAERYNKLTPRIFKTPGGKTVYNWVSGWSSGFSAKTTLLSALSENGIVLKHIVYRYDSANKYEFVTKSSDQEIENFLVSGKTTVADIINKYGEPNSNLFDDEGNRILVYYYVENSDSKYGWIPNVGGFVQAAVGSVKTRVTTLQIPLDANGVITSYKRETNNFEKGYGLFTDKKMKESRE